MNIQIYEKEEIHQAALDLLEEKGHTFTDNSEKAEAVLIRTMTQVDSAFLSKHPNLKHVLRVGVGLDNVDVDACKENGVAVLNSPGSNANAVAEHTMALILAMLRRIPEADHHVRAGKWDRTSFKTTELKGKTIGLVGFGAIPKLVAKKLQGFDVNIVSSDPFLSHEQIEIFPNTKKVEFDELLKKSDIVSVHVPLVKATEGMISNEQLALMKKNAILIITARGKIIDEAMLVGKLTTKTLTAALDVFAVEPPKDSPLLEMDNVILTPHISAMTEEAYKAMAVVVVENFLKSL